MEEVKVATSYEDLTEREVGIVIRSFMNFYWGIKHTCKPCGIEGDDSLSNRDIAMMAHGVDSVAEFMFELFMPAMIQEVEITKRIDVKTQYTYR